MKAKAMSPAPSQLIQDLDIISNPRFDFYHVNIAVGFAGVANIRQSAELTSIARAKPQAARNC